MTFQAGDLIRFMGNGRNKSYYLAQFTTEYQVFIHPNLFSTRNYPASPVGFSVDQFDLITNIFSS